MTDVAPVVPVFPPIPGTVLRDKDGFVTGFESASGDVWHYRADGSLEKLVRNNTHRPVVLHFDLVGATADPDADTPAQQWADGSHKRWNNGRNESKDLEVVPAALFRDGTVVYYAEERLHRRTGPAVENVGKGTKSYFLEGVEVSKEEHDAQNPGPIVEVVR